MLFEASSQAKTCGGSTGTSFWNHSSTCFIASDLTVMLPSLSTICGAVAAQHGVDPGDRVVGDAERHAEGMAALVAFLGGVKKRVPGPFVGQFLVGRRAGRIHLGEVEPDDIA